MIDLLERSPTSIGKYLVYGGTKNLELFWVDYWNGETFEGIGKRVITKWASISLSLFQLYPEIKPSTKGRYLIAGLRNREPDMWVSYWNKFEFKTYPRQEVMAFQELPLI